ncbi:MAG: NAD(P)/FAD-dependent oxidoreductase [Ezakiella sp.]|nr:NAD(P)/FAD-dependent oxidoreductase [Ezakiella sp.]MDD7471886.1 NAD(P)/FAD-dependent oxidoreductase [Bacillota bacterium]MDY3923850.1 NAD(P)/FAD-dependent oxidoreductase [Ezakiella sp.]
MYKSIIIGAGAAGLFLASLLNDKEVLVLEKNSFPGKKLNITGKGRCNITNSCDERELIKQIFTNGKFFYSAFRDFTNFDTVRYFNELGVKTKIERGGRIFPISDKARDVTNALYHNNICTFKFNEEVMEIKKESDKFIVKTKNASYESKAVVIATGGISYPTTGSTGDGYIFLERFGHKIVNPKPALVGVETEFNFKQECMGISLKNVEVKLIKKNQVYKKEFGEALFTHYGLSGPIILRLSPFVEKGDNLSLDLKPALDHKKLCDRIQRDFDASGSKLLKNSLNHLLLKNLIEPILCISGLDGGKEANKISKEERNALARTIKNMEFTVINRRPLNEAIITDGGVSVKEVNPKTMESKLVDNLFIIGEVLDIAANTGGFNLQIAFSTAYKAYKSLEGIN